MTQGSLFETGGARFDDSGRFRYELWRDLGDKDRCVCFIMLNPSTADANHNDPTVRRCIGFARSWGFGSLCVTNLYALRATNPFALKRDPCDAVGDPENLITIIKLAKRAELVVAAWGTNPGKLVVPGVVRRDGLVAAMLKESGAPSLHCLEVTAEGFPRHPLYCRADLQPRPFAIGS